MKDNYGDIRKRIAARPNWYDQNGAPRYGEFTPRRCPNIYSKRVGLFRIACQCCDSQFNVEMHADIWGSFNDYPPAKWHYGDPPSHGCVGDTMNCEDLEVLQFWTQENPMNEWERRPEFEGIIDAAQPPAPSGAEGQEG